MNFIAVNEPDLSGNEKKYLCECIDSGWISSEGPFVKKFEFETAKYFDRKYAVAVSSGSAALDIAVKALGIGEGDEVILPTFTIISCALSIIRCKAKPVLVDSDLLTWNMNVADVEAKITPRTKAIMIVHIYGLPVDVDPILELARKYGLFVIEDAAEMHGQMYKNKKCGSIGDISILSFYPNKLVTTGEGGMILTDDRELAEKCESFRNLCFLAERRFLHKEIGWNYRMTNMQAALGLAQLERIQEFIDRKRAMGKLYTKLLKNINAIQLPIEKTDYAYNIYWVYGIVIKDEVEIDASQAMEKLRKFGIGTRPFFYPMHMQPVFKEMNLFLDENYPIAEFLSAKGFYIPSGLNLKKEQIEYIAEKVAEVFS